MEWRIEWDRVSEWGKESDPASAGQQLTAKFYSRVSALRSKRRFGMELHCIYMSHVYI